MSRQRNITQALAVAAMGLALTVSAQAGASRTFVSTTGSDANVSVNCGATANCRTFGVALSVTNSGGELVVVNSGGYGPATISQPVIITAIGIDASISVTTSGANGLTINTPGNVTLTGLNLHGEATGANGIEIQQVGFLRLYNMLIENFTGNGVDFETSGKLAVYASAINDNAGSGVFLNNASANAYVHDSSFDHNLIGVGVNAGNATVADSSSQYNTGGFGVVAGTLTLYNDRAMFNTVGMGAQTGGAMYFADCLISNNTNAYTISGGTIAGTSPGTSLIAPGQLTTGTLSTAIALQ